jgi:hypothetical protein
MLADLTVARQHVSNQYEQTGKAAGAALFGMVETKDIVI